MKKVKLISTVIALLLMMISTLSFTKENEGGVIMIISLEVKSFDDWKKGFDAGASIREKAGIKVISVCRSVDNPNKVVVIEEVETIEIANGFIELLKSKQKAGEISTLEYQILDKVE
jgi:hypothetical protein